MRRMRFVGLRFVLFGVLGVGVVGLLVSELWNALMPAILGLPAITFWQALGLLLLTRLLFGGHGGFARRMRNARFVRGWKDLTPEQRERFRNAMGTRGSGPCRPGFEEGEPAPKL
jgi:hypothetical protein